MMKKTTKTCQFAQTLVNSLFLSQQQVMPTILVFSVFLLPTLGMPTVVSGKNTFPEYAVTKADTITQSTTKPERANQRIAAVDDNIAENTGAVSGVSGQKTSTMSGVPAAGNISVQDAAALLKNAPPSLIILDVRTPGEFREGHIPGARNMDFFGGGFEMQAASLPHDAVLLVYCRSGKRSAGAAEILDEADRKSVV